jgi:hypothetical protein
MEHEEIFALMMDTLDGELAENGKQDLESHLRACPDLSPAAGFTQRTIARLPNRKARMWAISAIYGMVLFSGLIPVLIGILAINKLGPILSQPPLVQSVLHSLQTTVQVVGTILAALLNSAGEVILQQPTLIGWLMVMVGIVFLWGGVYRQLSAVPVSPNS